MEASRTSSFTESSMMQSGEREFSVIEDEGIDDKAERTSDRLGSHSMVGVGVSREGKDNGGNVVMAGLRQTLRTMTTGGILRRVVLNAGGDRMKNLHSARADEWPLKSIVIS